MYITIHKPRDISIKADGSIDMVSKYQSLKLQKLELNKESLGKRTGYAWWQQMTQTRGGTVVVGSTMRILKYPNKDDYRKIKADEILFPHLCGEA